MKKTNPETCTLKSCERKKNGVGALLCPDHWAMLPRPMKLNLWRAEKLRSRWEQQVQTMIAAGEILDWLEENVKIDLPPDVTILKPESELEVQKTNEPRILHP